MSIVSFFITGIWSVPLYSACKERHISQTLESSLNKYFTTLHPPWQSKNMIFWCLFLAYSLKLVLSNLLANSIELDNSNFQCRSLTNLFTALSKVLNALQCSILVKMLFSIEIFLSSLKTNRWSFVCQSERY